MAGNEDLLECMVKELELEYISDLREERSMTKALDFVRKVDGSKYSVREWNDAIHYLTGKIGNAKDPEEGKALLAQFLSERITLRR